MLDNLYDDIWVYGLKEMGSPIDGLDLASTTVDKIAYTGYLDREIPSDRNWVPPIDMEEPFILVTAGGGGDGVDMVDWVIRRLRVRCKAAPPCHHRHRSFHATR